MIVDTETGEVVTINQPIRHWHTHNSVVDKNIHYSHDHYYHKSAGSRARGLISGGGIISVLGILLMILIITSTSQTLKNGRTFTIPLEGYLQALSSMPDTDVFDNMLETLETLRIVGNFDYITSGTPYANFYNFVVDFLIAIYKSVTFVPSLILRVVNIVITIIRLVIITFPI